MLAIYNISTLYMYTIYIMYECKNTKVVYWIWVDLEIIRAIWDASEMLLATEKASAQWSGVCVSAVICLQFGSIEVPLVQYDIGLLSTRVDAIWRLAHRPAFRKEALVHVA